MPENERYFVLDRSEVEQWGPVGGFETLDEAKNEYTSLTESEGANFIIVRGRVLEVKTSVVVIDDDGEE